MISNESVSSGRCQRRRAICDASYHLIIKLQRENPVCVVWEFSAIVELMELSVILSCTFAKYDVFHEAALGNVSAGLPVFDGAFRAKSFPD